MPKSKLPDRWEDYSNIGDVISGTRILAFKVPLNEDLCSRYPDELWFTPQTLIETTEANGTPLGLIIDLTFTRRYYNPQVFTDQGIDHRKIFVPGKEVPTPDIVDEFCSTIEAFTADPNNIDKLVGVHCTHGLNRTGHLVCRYMIDRLNIEPEVAITAYGKARGYPIERENYLADLRGVQGDGIGDPAKDSSVSIATEGTTDAKRVKPSPYHRHSDPYERHDQRPRWSDGERNSESYRNDFRGQGYSGQGRGQGWQNDQHGHRSEDRNWRAHSSNGPYSHDNWQGGWNGESSYHGYGNGYHQGNHSRGHYSGGYGSQNPRDEAGANSGRSVSRNSYNSRGGQNGRRSRQSGGWSLNTESDYGNFGYSNYGDRSQGQKAPDNRSQSYRGQKR